MLNTKKSLFSGFLLLLHMSMTLSMTRQQLKKSGVLLKKTCMPKNNVSDDEVGQIEQGKFLEERSVMCYIACVFSASNVVKNNKINLEAMIKQVDMMFPTEMKDAVKSAIQTCKNIGKNYKDICEASYWTAKCMYDKDPANFVFP